MVSTYEFLDGHHAGHNMEYKSRRVKVDIRFFDLVELSLMEVGRITGEDEFNLSILSLRCLLDI